MDTQRGDFFSELAQEIDVEFKLFLVLPLQFLEVILPLLDFNFRVCKLHKIPISEESSDFLPMLSVWCVLINDVDSITI